MLQVKVTQSPDLQVKITPIQSDFFTGKHTFNLYWRTHQILLNQHLTNVPNRQPF